MTISSEIIKFATSRTSSFTKKELLEFLKAGTEDVSAGTVHVLLNRLVESGKLAKAGHGLFILSDMIKPPYVYIPNDAEKELSSALKRKFPFVTCCVWKASAITPFMQHIPSMSFILVDVERIAMDAVFQHLQGQYPESMILLNPSQSDCDRYLNMDNLIVVRPLIAEAPLSTYQGVNTPSIEKILVDIVSEKEFDYAGGAELYHIYNNVFESIEVNKKKLLRYASRRNRKERIEQILKSNNL
ncbi:MAG: hypothetical protein MJZ41_16825 [Bacteroidaceae bacterium]|nr:hypothetical protein [Bacteroidaceae bacterium]